MTTSDKDDEVKFVDQVAALGFVQLPVTILRDSRLSDGEMITYATLLTYARNEQRCWPGLKRLAMDRGVDVRTITNHVAQLKKHGLVTTHRRPGTSQVYWIAPTWKVYCQPEAPHLFTEEALAFCNLDDDGRIPRRNDVKVSKDVSAVPQADARTQALGIMAATQRSEERRAERGKKAVSRQSAKVDKKLAVTERKTGLTVGILERYWTELYVEKWPKLPRPSWGAGERKTARNLVTTYPDLVKPVCERVITWWEECTRRWKLDGQPTIGFVWGFRETLFAEAAQGIHPGGAKHEAMRADEFNTEAGLDKSGW